MMQNEHPLLSRNRTWSADMVARDATFFEKLAEQQAPDYLWIGCSDSRVPATQLVGLLPGDMFVHRNVANVVAHSDLNCLSVLQYAVEALKVQQIIVCGHYGCGGVMAAMNDMRLGLIDNWLRHIHDVRSRHETALARIDDPVQRLNRLCELNVIEQVKNVCETSIMQSAWDRGQSLSVHGWIYSIHDGLLRDLEVTCTSPQELAERYAKATA